MFTWWHLNSVFYDSLHHSVILQLFFPNFFALSFWRMFSVNEIDTWQNNRSYRVLETWVGGGVCLVRVARSSFARYLQLLRRLFSLFSIPKPKQHAEKAAEVSVFARKKNMNNLLPTPQLPPPYRSHVISQVQRKEDRLLRLNKNKSKKKVNQYEL